MMRFDEVWILGGAAHITAEQGVDECPVNTMSTGVMPAGEGVYVAKLGHLKNAGAGVCVRS